jgi:putative DNA primase/helicase
MAALKGLGLWAEGKKHVDRRRIVKEYDYTDEHGDNLYQVVRTEPKGFFQRYRGGGGEWIHRKHPQQMLYRLPEVLAATIVFVCEGEKDVETLRAQGFAATTIAGGSNAKWLPSFSAALRGRTVILIPDNDEPGWTLMRRIADALLGKAARLMCFDDHHRAGLKDITDWFERGHSEVELVNLLEVGWRSA